MRPTARPLFAQDRIEILQQDALEAIGAAVRRLPLSRLGAPSLARSLAERALPRPPRLGGHIRYRLFEAEIAGRQGEGVRQWAPAVELVVPFRGPCAYFSLRAGTVPLHAPVAMVRARSILLTEADPKCSATELVERLEAHLDVIRRELEEQRRHWETMSERLTARAQQRIEERRRHLSTLSQAAELLDARGWRATGG